MRTPDPGLLVFLVFVVLGSLLVFAAVRHAWRTRSRVRGGRRSGVPRGRRNPNGGRSSRPRVRRRKRCAVYYYPTTFTDDREAYWGMSVDPKRRDAGHRNTDINPRTGKPYGDWWAFTPYVGEMKIYRWFDDEDQAYDFEQGMIGKRQSLFNIEGNHGHGIKWPGDPRMKKIHKLWLASQERRVST